jgi:hypothetical protein
VSEESDVAGPGADGGLREQPSDTGPTGEPSADDRTEATGEHEDAIEQAKAALDEARRRLAEVPAEVVVTNHVMGLYELAAIHLREEKPNLKAATLAIDAMGYLVEGLGDRLGEHADTLRDALANIRMTFVAVKKKVTTPSS